MKKFFAVLLLTFISISCKNPQPKTAYVDMVKLTESYQKLQDTQKQFDQKQRDLATKYDSLAQAFQQKYRDFLKRAQHMSKAQADKEYQKLAYEQQAIQMNQQKELSELQNQADQAIKAVLDSLKNFFENYGKSNGYDYIFSKNELNNLLYGKDSYDITDQVIEALNGNNSKDRPGKDSGKK